LSCYVPGPGAQLVEHVNLLQGRTCGVAAFLAGVLPLLSAHAAARSPAHRITGLHACSDFRQDGVVRVPFTVGEQLVGISVKLVAYLGVSGELVR
jgi:hypothetical protein